MKVFRAERLFFTQILHRIRSNFTCLWYNKNQPPKNLDFTRLFGGFVANVLH